MSTTGQSDKCIFQAEELKHLCEFDKCNKNKNKCVSLAYVNLVQAYVTINQRMNDIKKNWEKGNSSRAESEPKILEK
jgi:hypothetical protein